MALGGRGAWNREEVSGRSLPQVQAIREYAVQQWKTNEKSSLFTITMHQKF